MRKPEAQAAAQLLGRVQDLVEELIATLQQLSGLGVVEALQDTTEEDPCSSGS